ncbi:FprA family A-type flavoprotein [candidate division FCPU426 bacterium]|nr:FprA family A-type flavoprotein [candidate division FCPU426 bacterium]
MKAIPIKPDLYWVGAKDWNLRDFHGYKTQRGSTYNAFLLLDEKVVLIDTVKSYLCEEMMTRIRSVVDPAKIDMIVSNHVEMDHSGSLEAVLHLAPAAEVLTSVHGEKGLQAHFNTSGWNLRAVGNGEERSTGRKSLAFFHIPLVHWPDSMATYIPADKVLLPNDAFGQHIALGSIFDHESPLDVVMQEAAKYYANIVYPYGSQVEKALAALQGLDFNLIGPSHGIIWRRHHQLIMEKYKQWARHDHEEKAVVVYDTMWGSTETLAQAAQAAFEDQGVPVIVRSLKHSHISDVMTDVLEARYVVLGTPTLNNGMLPTLGAFMTYLKGLKPQRKTGFVFGSYGWNPQALKEVEEILRGLGWELPEPAFNVKYRPQAGDVQKLKAAVAALCRRQTNEKKGEQA